MTSRAPHPARQPRSTPEPAPCALDSDLGWTLGTVFRLYMRAAADAADDIPGGHRGYQVLTEAATNQPGTQLALAHRLGIDRTVMTYLIDDLERAGLVSRQPDPADRRARRIVATECGRARLAGLDQRLRQAEEHVLAALDQTDRETLRDLLRRVATHASEPGQASNPCQVVAEVASEFTSAG